MQTLIAAGFLTISSWTCLGQSPQQIPKTKSVEPYIPAIVQAVEDEIYDHGYETNYFEIDNQGAGDTTPAKISIYISKEISEDGGDGIAVYKLMPYGEVYRLFYVRQDGLVMLLGEPEQRFHPTGGSMLTVYMSDDDVCDFIMRQAIKSSFVVDPEVSKQRLSEAIRRELKRTGFSYRRYAAQHPKKKKG
jgi:hypothetical protein